MTTQSTTRRYRVETDDGTGPYELTADGYELAFAELEGRGYPLARVTALAYLDPASRVWVSADDLLYALKRETPAGLPLRTPGLTFHDHPADPSDYLSAPDAPGGDQ